MTPRLGIVVVLLAAAALRARFIGAHPGEGFRDTNIALYYAQFERHYLSYGLLGSRFAMVLQWWPGTEKGRILYVTHPPTPSWLFHAGVRVAGSRNLALGLRIVPFVVSVLGLLAFHRLSRRVLEPVPAFAAVLVAASVPMLAYFGVMCEGLCFHLLAGSLLVTAYLDWRAGRCRLRWLCLLYFAGCLLDWSYYFYGPALLIVDAPRPGPWRARLALLALVPFALLAFGLFIAHAAWATGSLKTFVAGFRSLAATSSSGGGATALEWLRNQSEKLVAWYGIPLLALSGGGLLFKGRDGLRPMSVGRAAAVFLIAGALNVGAFRFHAFGHDYWTLPLAPGLCLLAGAMTAWSLRRNVVARSAVAALLAASVVWGVWKTIDAQNAERTTRYEERAAAVNRLAGPDDIVLTSEPFGLEMYDIRAHAVPMVRTVERLRAFIDLYASLGTSARVLLLIGRQDLETDEGVREVAAIARKECGPPRTFDQYLVFEAKGGAPESR